MLNKKIISGLAIAGISAVALGALSNQTSQQIPETASSQTVIDLAMSHQIGTMEALYEQTADSSYTKEENRVRNNVQDIAENMRLRQNPVVISQMDSWKEFTAKSLEETPTIQQVTAMGKATTDTHFSLSNYSQKIQTSLTRTGMDENTADSYTASLLKNNAIDVDHAQSRSIIRDLPIPVKSRTTINSMYNSMDTSLTENFDNFTAPYMQTVLDSSKGVLMANERPSNSISQTKQGTTIVAQDVPVNSQNHLIEINAALGTEKADIPKVKPAVGIVAEDKPIEKITNAEREQKYMAIIQKALQDPQTETPKVKTPVSKNKDVSR